MVLMNNETARVRVKISTLKILDEVAKQHGISVTEYINNVLIDDAMTVIELSSGDANE